MSDESDIIEGDATTLERPLGRSDMAKPGALQTFQERGAVGQTNLPMSTIIGAPRFDNMLQVMEFAKLMAMADIAVRPHLRGNPGACLAIVLKAQAWQFEPFFVAEKSYAVRNNKTGEISIAFESQLVHAVIERRAPLQRRLRFRFAGAGAEMKCTVIGHVIGETEPMEWESPAIGEIKIKNSPEWVNNPKKQLFYHTSRDWARIYFPDVLGGVYTRDELEGAEVRQDQVRAPSVLDRLADYREEPREPDEAEGFNPEAIQRTLERSRGESGKPPATQEPTSATEPSEPAKGGKAPRKKREAASPEPTPAPAGAPVSEEQGGRGMDDPGITGGAEPADSASYIAHAEGWIGRIKNTNDAALAEASWEGERDVRAKCRLTVTERKRLEGMLKTACAKARVANAD